MPGELDFDRGARMHHLLALVGAEEHDLQGAVLDLRRLQDVGERSAGPLRVADPAREERKSVIARAVCEKSDRAPTSIHEPGLPGDVGRARRG
jgi:hypothetical protein